MRKLYLGNGDKQFKFADTTTEIHLNAFDDGSAATLTADAKVRIKNESGYLLGVSANITENHAVITSEQLVQLPVGSYLLELWDTVDGGTAIYPSDGFLALQINENVTGLSGGLVSSITVDEFIQQFSSLSGQLKQEVANAIANGLKGDTGAQGLSAYQIAVINGYKGSQTDWLTSLVGPTGLKGEKGESWTDAGVYQSAGIADGSITEEKLSPEISNAFGRLVSIGAVSTHLQNTGSPNVISATTLDNGAVNLTYFRNRGYAYSSFFLGNWRAYTDKYLMVTIINNTSSSVDISVMLGGADGWPGGSPFAIQRSNIEKQSASKFSFKLNNDSLETSVDFTDASGLFLMIGNRGQENVNQNVSITCTATISASQTKYTVPRAQTADLSDFATKADNANNALEADHSSHSDYATAANNSSSAGAISLVNNLARIRGTLSITDDPKYGHVRLTKGLTPADTDLHAVYFKVVFDSLEDIRGDLKFSITDLNPDIPSGGKKGKLTDFHIQSKLANWGPDSDPYGIAFLPGGQVDIYEKMLECGVADYYAGLGYFYIVIAAYNPNDSLNTAVFDYDICGYISPTKSLVVATQISDNLKTDIIAGAYDQSITCWGDSLTAGGGWTTTLQTLSGMPVKNGGTGGEQVQTITARQGADVMQVDNLTIPAETTPVTIATRAAGGIATQFGKLATPLLQGGAHVNPARIGDIEGTLQWTGSSYSDTSGTWTFTRTTAGDDVKISRPTALRTDFDVNENRPYLMIIFIGQNGGWDSPADLVRMHRLMIDHAQAKHYLILGLHTGTAESRADYEAAMLDAFGRNFFSLRQYLASPITNSAGTITSCYGLDDAGLTPTSDDLAKIAVGQVPLQLLADGTHYTSVTKTVVGNAIYKYCCDLNIF